jgi:hypothetical protein
VATAARLATIRRMKAILCILTAIVCLTLSAPAEVFVYKNKMKYNITGGGGVEKISAAGWTIINDFGEVIQVLAYTAAKRYSIVPLQNITYDSADAGGGRQYSFFIQHDVWNDGNGQLHIDTGGAKGLNVVTLVNGEAWSIPKTFTWGGRSMYPATSTGNMRFEESSGTLTFDKKWTDITNSEGDDLNAAAQRLATALEEQGYISYTEEI